MNKRQVLLAAAIASLSLVSVAQANEVAGISDVAVNSAFGVEKGAANDCANRSLKPAINSCKDVAHSCAGFDVKAAAGSCAG